MRATFKVPDYQVAGHQALDGKLGPLIDDSGRFYKPLQDGDRGSRGEGFYKSLLSEARIPDNIRRFFPVFHGTQLIEASDGSGSHPYLVLEDLVSNLVNPSIMDIKIGSRTWYPEATEDYMEIYFKKDKESTSVQLGFKICGLQVYESKESGFWKPDKKFFQYMSVEDVTLLLKKFVSSNSISDSDSDPDCSFASTVYGATAGILAQLQELKEWFEDQTIFHFSSCSVLFLFEKKSLSSDAIVKLVDFAHVVEGRGVIDHNFLGGLCSLIKFISGISTSPEETRFCSDNVTTK